MDEKKYRVAMAVSVYSLKRSWFGIARKYSHQLHTVIAPYDYIPHEAEIPLILGEAEGLVLEKVIKEFPLKAGWEHSIESTHVGTYLEAAKE